ncbi:uncharacterized protein CTHT_0042940 [Thermochaetoides thermophila DSM 1495]|uniref:Ribonuclease H2 subunit B n=1 Tax=Chaetomium thermophilum (strain DSM 1495 / CBS 144.50 / IMI 039719) TaxID=759272 RepID=G0SAN8_CHATD|nr:hypothetical protein CTHT_0042940 [Thermochaetoides thermophila DSM 1495]EGS19810.1 hypothetical protein CTHT_0042940 [Thermochaetoides thermophila DSM 1495]
MARTRSKAASFDPKDKAKDQDSQTKDSSSPQTSSSKSIYSLPEPSDRPSQVFILPKSATSSARIITLANPRTGSPTRYLVCPKTGFFEITKVTPPKSAPRSWLVQRSAHSESQEDGEQEGAATTTAQTISSPTLYLATPFDPVFLLLPALIAEPESAGTTNHLLDLLDLHHPSLREILSSRLAAVCDVVQAGDEDMYRLSEEKLVGEMLVKARRMISGNGLPASLEERWVKKALEAPVVGVRVVKRGDSGSQVSTNGESQGTTPDEEEPALRPAIVASPEVVHLQRLRTALDFLSSRYLPPTLSALLKFHLTSQSPLSKKFNIDFTPLDEYLAQLTKVRQEAAASRATTDFSRKRLGGGGNDDDEEADEKAEKRRKKEQEERIKKQNVSRGVRELAKVNTKGMMKLSEFFKKKT